MNESVRKVLDAKFPKKQIKRRKLGTGDGERMVDYVTGSIVIRRLNEAFEGEWSFEIREKIVDMTENQIAVLGRLTVPRWRVETIQNESRQSHTDQHNADIQTSGSATSITNDTTTGRETTYNIVKEQWGGSAIERYKSSKTVIDLGNNMKAAATDALKKCASLLGVGLHLYDVDEVGSTVLVDEESEGAVVAAVQTAPEEVKPASKIQQQAVLKVLGAKKVEPKALFDFLKIAGIEAIDSVTAGSIITMKHDFWKGISA